MTAIFAAACLTTVAYQFALAGGSLDRFSIYGLNSLAAAVALNAVVIVLFAHKDPSSATTRNLMLVYVVSFFVRLGEGSVLRSVSPDFPYDANAWAAYYLGWGLFLVYLVWMVGATRRAFQASPHVRRPALRGLAFTLVFSLSGYLTPHWPVFIPDHFHREVANFWEARRAVAQPSARATAAAARQAEARGARVEARQGALLDAALAKLAPRDPSKANVFAIGVAGWSDQAVFMRETRKSLEILGARFGVGERGLALINNEATADELPMASMQNLSAALRGIAARMDRDNDVLLLTLTSHGSPDGFALNYNDFVQRTLDPETLRIMLDEAGIKHRIVIVSSCYSGTFVAPLRDPDTMVLTAASATRTSFGCADDRNWTYFGEALFEKALAQDASLADAFAVAKATIANWEREQRLTPSEPQIFVGEALAQRFPALVGKAPPATDPSPDQLARP